MPLDTAQATNDFLYFRDIKENPLPQPNTLFSAPHDEMFFGKLNKYLDAFNNDSGSTQEALTEALRQLRSHSLTPLGAVSFFADSANFYALQRFYRNPQNQQWRQELCETLVMFCSTIGSLSALENANSELLDDFFQFILGEFSEYPVLIEIIDCCCENLSLFKDQQQIFFDKALRFVQEWRGAGMQHLLSALTKIGRSSWENYAEALKLGRALISICISEQHLEEHLHIFTYINFLINLDVKSANYFKELLQIAIDDLYRYDHALQQEAFAFIGKMVQVIPQLIPQQLLQNAKNNAQPLLIRLLDGIKKGAQSGYDAVRSACCQCCIFLVDGPLRKEKGLFLEILGILGEQGVEYVSFSELQRLMQGAKPQDCLIERQYADVRFGE